MQNPKCQINNLFLSPHCYVVKPNWNQTSSASHADLFLNMLYMNLNKLPQFHNMSCRFGEALRDTEGVCLHMKPSVIMKAVIFEDLRREHAGRALIRR